MRTPTLFKRLVISAFLLIACISVLQGINNAVLKVNGSQDNQWSGSRVLLKHEDPYAAYLDPERNSSFILMQAPNYPASGLMMLWPYAVWDWQIAKTLWAFSNLLFTAIILVYLFRMMPANTSRYIKLTIAALFLISTSWRNVVGNGQHALFTLAFFLVAVNLLPRRAVSSGISLGASWFKYSISFPLTLYYARTKRGMIAILTAITIHIALTLFAALWVGTSPLNLLLGPLKILAVGTGYVDVFAIATKLGVSSALVPGLAALGIITITYAAILKSHDNLSCLSTLALMSCAVIFHLSYDFVVLVIPLSYALREGLKDIRSKYYLTLVLLIWFADKAVFMISCRMPQYGGLILDSFFWVRVLAYYGALITDWIILMKPHAKKAVPPQL